MSRDEDLDALAAELAWGTLDADERERALERLEAQGVDADAAIEDARRIGDRLAYGYAPVAPSPELRRELLARVQGDAQADAAAGADVRHAPRTARRAAPPRRSRLRWTLLVQAAGLLLIVGLSLRLWQLGARLDEVERSARVEVSGEQVAGLEGPDAPLEPASKQVVSPRPTTHSVQDWARWMTITSGQATYGFELIEQRASPGASGVAFLQLESDRLIVHVSNLPRLEPTETYQVWLDDRPEGDSEGALKSAGSFDLDPAQPEQLYFFDHLPALRGHVKLIITREPTGGSPQPTGTPVLAGW